MKNEPKSNPIAGAVAAQMQRGISQHKAIAMTGIGTKTKPTPVNR